jgi:Cell division protein FtsI/penicillin-binding protein 2
MARKRITDETKARANTRTMKRIGGLMVVLGFVIFLPLFATLYDLQIRQHDELEKRAIDQQTKDVEVSASRGSIYDRNGDILAISASVHNVILSPRDIAANELDKDKLAQGLSYILGIDPADILARMERTNSAYELIARKVEEDVANQVRQLVADYNADVAAYNLTVPRSERQANCNSGLYLMPDTKRYYPKNELAAQVIGFVNAENVGAYGMEALYESQLRGRSGRVVTARSGSGTELPFRYEDMFDPESGNNLNLTIDATIQMFAEKTLAEGIEEFEVQRGGVCIIMNPKTGAILGFANAPDYDLNAPHLIADEATRTYIETLEGDEKQEALAAAQYAQWRNKGLSDTYEPGSTFKTMVLAAALEEGLVNEHSTYYCSGVVTVAGEDIKCHKRTGHGAQTLYEAIENSCNPALIAIGLKIGAEKFYDYLEDFGFLNLTNVDLQGEAGSIIWSRSYFTSPEGLASLATASFGQTLKVSPMQLIAAAAASVNGGHLMQPYVLDSITDSNGAVIHQTQPIEVRQVISEETSAEVRMILEGVVGNKDGTGKNAYVAGYRIGGKTGTSQKRDEGSQTVAVSFLGFAPANDPEIIMLLIYDAPKQVEFGGNYTSRGWYISGGNMPALKAGPLMANILDYIGIEKQYSAAELGTVDTLVPNVIGQSAESARNMLNAKGFEVRMVGDGGTVVAQVPAAGAAIPGQSRIIIYFGEARPQETVTVPSVIGYGPEYARQVIINAGLYMRTTGITDTYNASTVASGQSITVGTEVKPGTVIEVNFGDRSLTD